MTGDALQTNANFQQVLDELDLLGDEATRNPTDDPLYQQFITRFPAHRLPQLSLAEYCVGKGDGESFCWWLERGLQPLLGRYMPGTSRGHILYFQKDGTVYKHRRLKALSDEEALRYTLRIQACIAQADLSQDPRWIDSDAQLYERAGVEARVTVGDGRKLRLLSCYHPDETLPISSSPHLGHFLEVLGCPAADLPPKHQPVARMLLLRGYFELARQSVPGLTPRGFMMALYSERLGLAPIKEVDAADDADLDDGKEAKKAVQAPTGSSNPARQPLNQILYGPPGTGKTYATIDAALAILDPTFLAANLSDRRALKARFDTFERERRVRFVTFHQSFSYEDFVEGLRATTNEDSGQIRYEVVDGVFKSLCEAAAAKVTLPKETGSSATPINIQGRRIWKMSLGNTLGSDAAIYDECINKGYALLGYGGGIDFSGCTSRADVLERCKANDLSVANPHTDYTVTSVTAFVTRMKPGDLLVISDGNFKFRAIGEVSGDYKFQPHSEYPDGYAQMRPVEWLRVYEPSLPHGELMKSQFSQMTLYELRSPSIDLDKLQLLLGAQVTGSASGRGLQPGPIGSSDYKITKVTNELVELSKPNGNRLHFARSLLQILADAVASGALSIDDIRNKQAVTRLPDEGLEPYIVNGYANVLAPLVEQLLGLTGTQMADDIPVAANDARVLVIDEINRGNISRIFGELITLIEPSKRAGSDEALQVLLPYSKQPFSVPANVFLVGTMNTADRSLAAMDVALRRRFVFKEMPPRPGRLKGVEVGAIRIDELLTAMNQRIEALLDRDHCIGHAYFMPLSEDASAAKLAEIFRAQVLPLLQEYFFDDWQRIQWVLNDHRKRNAAYRFVTASEVNIAKLFGSDVNVARSPQLWRINEDAFLCEQSYLGVINHEDASV